MQHEYGMNVTVMDKEEKPKCTVSGYYEGLQLNVCNVSRGLYNMNSL